MDVLKCKAYLYCVEALEEPTTPKYVKMQIRQWMDIVEGKDDECFVSGDALKQVESVLKLLIVPKGLKMGQSYYKAAAGFQWLLITAMLCTRSRENPAKRKYELGLLEIARKNGKTNIVALLFLLLFIMEPPFSKFYSVAPDASLSREIKSAMEEIIKASPLIREYDGIERFKMLRDWIEFRAKESRYYPLAFSTSRMDGKLPSAWVADEVGALTTPYPLEAMRSGQLTILNKLGFIISTKYPTIDNPFEDEVAYSKKVLDGLIEDKKRFSLLFEPDNTKDWETDDLILAHANPLALVIPEIWDDLLLKRKEAIEKESSRENFVTKHCDIIYQGIGTETYIDTAAVKACRVDNIDWNGRAVYVGLDLAETNDNASVAIAAEEDGAILADVFAYIPADRIDEKMRFEKVNYRELIKTQKVTACGNRVIDYNYIETVILTLEEKLGVKVMGVAYDRWNALSTAQKLENNGINTVEVRQHSSTLHAPTKLLEEKILDGKFAYTENKLLEINFQNARCIYDTNKNKYIAKKRSKGKVDMVVSLINAVYLLQQDVIFDQCGFTVQVI